MSLVEKLKDAPFVGFEAAQIASACGVSRQAIEHIASILGVKPGVTAGGRSVYSARDLAIFRAHYESKLRRGEAN